MKKLLLILLFLGIWSKSHSQIITQTYIDRCTNVVYTFTVVPNGQSVVTFYNRSQVFTAAQFTNGTLQAWLEETYQWWSTLNPCSAAQAETTTAQQTAQQTTQAATQAATNAASAAPPPPPPPPATNTTNTTNTSTNATSNTADTSSTSNTTSTGSTESSNTDSSTSTGSSGSGESNSDSSGGSGEGGSSDTETKQEETKTKETKSEESKSEESSESEEKIEEEKKEESKEEEKSEEESKEEKEEEKKEEEKKEEEKKEEDKKKEKKKNLAPPILAANVMSMQMLDGSWSTAASFGVSQSSLTGQETYSANAMVWTNFQQFSLALSKSKVHFWSEYEGINYLIQQNGKKIVSPDPETGRRPKDRQNQIHHVGSTSFNYMNMFGTNVITAGYSHVILGQNDNFWKGFAGGYAAMGSLIILPESLLLSPSLTLFGTKPVVFKALPRWGFAPMVAVSLTPIQLTNQDKQINVTWNEYFTYIIGTNVNFNLTQRFGANLGINTINNTNPFIPTTFAITIGARFAF